MPTISEPPTPPLVAHGEFERGREGFREQCGSRLAHDDGGQRACEQPESVKQAFEAWSHRLEEGQRRGADDVPAPRRSRRMRRR